MDLFKFRNSGTPPFLKDGGYLINGLTSKMWVERYFGLGEFSIEAPLSSGLQDFLPIGSTIGKVDSLEVMIAESHNIKEPKEEDPKLVISGRTFPSWLENRVVGIPLARASSTIEPYIIGADASWLQIKSLIDDHVLSTSGGSISSDLLPNVDTHTSVGLSGTEEVERTINRGNLWERVKELLAIDDLGIRTIRQNSFTGGGDPAESNTLIDIYDGVDRSDTVIFSWTSGDIDFAEYLFSQKNYKNAALVCGQYVYVVVTIGPEQYDRRFMIVDATDIDGHFSEAPIGLALAGVGGNMLIRGREALRNQDNLTIAQADISENTKYQYRKDFNVGDLITVDGNFGQMAVMRVIEYAEIEDENGVSGHPTLALPLPEE